MKKILLLMIIGFSFFVMPVNAISNEPVVAEEIFAVVVVNADGSYDIQLDYIVDFREPRHGLEVSLYKKYDSRTIPGLGRSEKATFPITNVRTPLSETMDIYEDENEVVIRLGDPDRTVTGHKKYIIQYTMHTLPIFEDTDVFFLDIFPKTQYPLKNIDFRIEFPKALDKTPLFLATNQNIELDVDNSMGRYFSGSFNEFPMQEETITGFANLGSDYFNFPVHDYVWKSVFGLVIIMGMGTWIFLKKKPHNQIVESIEFEAPDGLNSAEVGLVYSHMSKPQHITSLIIYWASRGYLTIEELDKKNIKLTKIKNLDTDVSMSENTVFQELFKNGDEVTTKELENTFYQTIAAAQQSVGARFKGNDKLNSSKGNGALTLLGFVLGLVYGVSQYFSILTSAPYYPEEALIFGLISGVVMWIASIIAAYLSSQVMRNKNSVSLLGPVFISILGTALLNPFTMGLPLSILHLIVILISVFIMASLPGKSAYGAKVTGQVLGLKKFIQLAEKDKLEMLVHDTPYLFYDILPFAYVLDVTDVWSKKFESIAIQQPDWYVTRTPYVNFNSYLMWSSLNRSMGQMQKSFVSAPQTSSKSGGGFGGGGGGFSGGGFGGGSSGSW